MPRTIDDAVQASLEAVDRSEILLGFVTVTDPAGGDPIRIVCEEDRGISTKNGLPINYRLDGNLYHAFPFAFSRLSDDDRPARGTFNVPAFSSDIGDWFRSMAQPARIKVEYYALDAWLDTPDTVDGDNARNPVTTPELVYSCNHLFLRNASGSMNVITCDVGGYDFTQEPAKYRATKDLCPDIYR